MGEEPLAVAGGADVEPVDVRAAGGTERAAALVAPQPVAVVVHGPGRDDAARLRSRHRRAVALPGHRGRVGVGADRLAQTATVLDDRSRIVLGADAEVERGVRALAHAAFA